MYLTAKQAAEKLGVSDTTVYRLYKHGKIRGHNVERAIRIDPASVNTYLAAHRNPPEQELASALGTATLSARKPREGGEAQAGLS